jgi:hypothetical protein
MSAVSIVNEIKNYDVDDKGRTKALSGRSGTSYFSEDWATGIGGGLWSTGWPAAHFGTPHAHYPATASAKNEDKVGQGPF